MGALVTEASVGGDGLGRLTGDTVSGAMPVRGRGAVVDIFPRVVHTRPLLPPSLSMSLSLGFRSNEQVDVRRLKIFHCPPHSIRHSYRIMFELCLPIVGTVVAIVRERCPV